MIAITHQVPPQELQHSKQRQFRFYNVLMVVLMSFGSIEYGCSASIIATTLAQPSFISYFKLDTRDNATELIATTNGLYQAGGFFGVWTVSFLSDRWDAGSRLAYLRFGAFMIVTAIPIWMNEVVPPQARGILVDCHNVGFLLGYTLATVFGYAFYHLPKDNTWG
ncbi:uncharacterized protein Z518_01870 [Rhinocladiella mackenziei CBS 650.93]|uniref:Major facilitator superfamily (MFS) profile domain-containing protein n=1 Tax=Rhinocladiella mackenziei CBS 650.93 TaxID=1442369 RepID=A0A0D2FY42_9EURO|nr:uncharacterized protein Z518_01870 [Rhinocladiella mackenziei CBS 650.93]KIX07217.1 hypothetical protein Z518_01870 [Rhinocladiella mackenziei CBS 650.93]